ncbi:hypothetical protein [Treponema bryantii]|uniref:hypothetical protein n=1 Tax=Treponema bryantii TaxID=163 RepID=UPI002B2F6846|nr:hypothetical protein TRBR_04180 [Treponema bryantii]
MHRFTHRFKYDFNIENEYLVITGKCYSTLSDEYIGDNKIYLHIEDVLWVINTIRSFKKELYNRGSDDELLDHEEKDFVFIKMGGSDADRQYYGNVMISCTNSKSDHDSVLIPYYGHDPMAPSGEVEGHLYKFLMKLEEFVPENQKKDIIPQW